MRPTTHINFDLSSLITATETIYFTLHEPLPHLIHCRSDSSTNLCTISKLFNRRSTICFVLSIQYWPVQVCNTRSFLVTLRAKLRSVL